MIYLLNHYISPFTTTKQELTDPHEVLYTVIQLGVDAV